MQIENIGINGFVLAQKDGFLKLGTDAVLLSDFANIPARGRVCDLGCGIGAICVLIAATGNEIAYRVGLLETETLNLFFISPYCDPHLPVYSLVQGVVPFPWCLVIYIVGFSIAAYLMLLIAFGIKSLAGKGKEKVTA